jgi:parallel beta-helix repeat protein
VEELTNLFINGVQQPLGRWPNVTAPNRGYLLVKWASDRNKLSSLSIPDGAKWQGAELVVRNQRWVLDRVPILSTKGDTLTIEPTSYNISAEFGFFVCNHPATLDKNGEWCFNKATKKLTLYSEVNPSESVIEVSTVENLISIENQNFILIENLVLHGASSVALTAKHSYSIKVKNTEIVNSGLNGVYFISCKNPVFENNKVIDTNNQGFIFQDCHGSVIRQNEIRKNGLIAGMGANGSNSYNAMVVEGSSNLIEYNKLDSIGYIPLRFEGDSVMMRHNVISNYCMVKDDGGGIYTWGTRAGSPLVERKIIGNIVRNAIGAGHGTGDTLSVSSEGIYIDDQSSNVEIVGNTVYKCGNIGIFIHNANHVSVFKNLVFDNGTQLQFLSSGMPDFKIRDCIIKNNTFVSRIAAQKIANFITDEPKESIQLMGLIDSNYYCRPADPEMIIHCSFNPGEKWYSFNDWKEQFGHDQHTGQSPIGFKYKITSVGAPQKITYGFYHEGKDTWYDEKITGKEALEKIKEDLTGNPANPVKGMNIRLILSMGIDFRKGVQQKYLLSFDTKAEKAGEVIKANFKTGDNQIVCSQEFRLENSFRKNELLYIPAFANMPHERVNFEFSNWKDPVWIKNITFRKVEAILPNPDDHFLLVVNESGKPRLSPVLSGYLDVSGKVCKNQLMIQPYSSAIFFKK